MCRLLDGEERFLKSLQLASVTFVARMDSTRFQVDGQWQLSPPAEGRVGGGKESFEVYGGAMDGNGDSAGLGAMTSDGASAAANRGVVLFTQVPR